MDQNGTCDAGHSGAANLLLTDRKKKVVARVEVVESVRGSHA